MYQSMYPSLTHSQHQRPPKMSSGRGFQSKFRRDVPLELKKSVSINAVCHITGGGIIENLPRVIPSHYSALIEESSWKWLPVFSWLQAAGKISKLEMYRTFNCGVGMVLCVNSSDAEKTLEILEQHHLKGWKIGEIKKFKDLIN